MPLFVYVIADRGAQWPMAPEFRLDKVLFRMFRLMMDQMEQTGGDFATACRRLFMPEHGRRWKSAAASALAIGRTSLYRYLKHENQNRKNGQVNGAPADTSEE